MVESAMVGVITAGHVNWDVTLRVDALPKPDGEARIRSQCRSGGGSAASASEKVSGGRLRLMPYPIGPAPQMRSAYSRTARSEENQPMLNALSTARRFHASGSR